MYRMLFICALLIVLSACSDVLLKYSAKLSQNPAAPGGDVIAAPATPAAVQNNVQPIVSSATPLPILIVTPQPPPQQATPSQIPASPTATPTPVPTPTATSAVLGTGGGAGGGVTTPAATPTPIRLEGQIRGN